MVTEDMLHDEENTWKYVGSYIIKSTEKVKQSQTIPTF